MHMKQSYQSFEIDLIPKFKKEKATYHAIEFSCNPTKVLLFYIYFQLRVQKSDLNSQYFYLKH
jgi:hypothetical protein